MNLYLETSALLSWLLSEPEAPRVVDVLNRASAPVTSELTLAECRRALTRLGAMGQLDPGDAAARASELEQHSLGWSLVPVSYRILSGVQARFPLEPVRTLDALHLCTALDLRGDLPGLSVLSLDRRVRDNSLALGFTVWP